MDVWPQDVGIINMELYFPAQYVDQSELEDHDGVSKGKYTLGLGQTKMGFCYDNEDVNSLCLTALDNLIAKTPGVDFADIGRLEVGTETLVDKSKSVKSVLMTLFESSGNFDVEGVDCTNACYGGTAALFNCVSWIEGSSWDGRYAVAVCADIAIYASGNARPTGGAGAVAMLIGPNSSLVLERKLRATHAKHVYDFYKPEMDSEYPVVDGPLSIRCYLSSLDECYALYKNKCKGEKITIDLFDGILFHTPFCKLVQKSLARLALNDFLENPESFPAELVKSYGSVRLQETYFDKNLEKAFMKISESNFLSKTRPSLEVAMNVGNMYTPSLYGGLVSYLMSAQPDKLPGNRVGLFSYGSGSLASFFSLRIHPRILESPLISSVRRVRSRLESRTKIAPQEFSEAMSLREKVHHKAPYSPLAKSSVLFAGTWYLRSVDDLHRRTYDRSEVLTNGNEAH